MKVKHTNLINILLLSGFLALPLSHLLVPSVYADNLDFTVNITPSLTVTIPESTVSLNLNPASTTFSSQDLSITVGTNNPTGYTLSMTSTSTDLTRTIPFSDGSFATLSTLDTLSGGYTEDTFTTNRWGYKLGNNNYQPFALTNTINSSSSPVNADTTNLTFGAKVDFEQAEGTYELSLSFTAVANIVPPTTMQEMTLSECQAFASDSDYTIIDSRDGSDYTVRYINGNCWMTQNLRLSGGRTLTSADSNVASSWYFPSTSLTSGNSYTDAYSTISSNTSYGGYYNFCAASAGTNCQSSSTYNTTYDICPKGWRLPTYNEQQGITSYVSAFSPVYSGYYGDGSLYNAGSFGYWWSSTAIDSNSQYILAYRSGSLYTYGGYKYYGFSVRCVRSS
jgi:hypothetical protein